MLKLLKQLLGISSKQQVTPTSRSQPSIAESAKTTDAYFKIMGNMQEAVSKRNYSRAANLARKNLEQIPTFVRSWKQESGSFDLSSIPALEIGGTMLAIVGDDEGLAEMRRVISSNRDLQPWAETIAQHEEDRKLFTAILKAVKQNPGCRQTDMKSLVGTENGRRVSTLIGWLEKAGKISREKQGKTYALWLVGAIQAPAPAPKRDVRSHRTGHNSTRISEINVNHIPYIPLPKSPSCWEEAQVQSATAELPEAMDHFEVRDASGWKIGAIEKITSKERPDTAFRQLHPLDSGLLMIDDLGKAEKT